MRTLFDHGTPAPLRRHLEGHSVDLARQRGWDQIANGELLRLAELDGYEALFSNGRGFLYQHNLAGREMKIIVLRSYDWPISPSGIQAGIQEIRDTLEEIRPGEIIELRLQTR